MPLYMDIHYGMKDVTRESVEEAHMADLEAQQQYGVRYLKFWFNQKNGTVCCLVDAPNEEACHAVHHLAHGNIADKIIEVENQIVEDFLGGQSESRLGAALFRDGSPDTAFRTIMFTDLEGSTALTEAVGDEEAVRLINVHDRIIEGQLASFAGRKVKHTGDGILASFTSATFAIRCAIAMQRAFEAHREVNPDEPLCIRIGLTAGEPVEANNDLFGTAVNLARRVCDSAKAHTIYCSAVVRDLCAGKKIDFTDRGEQKLKGYGEPVRLFEVEYD